MERSFEDLLHGLSDEEDLDIDDLVGDNTGYSTNLEVCSIFSIFSLEEQIKCLFDVFDDN